MYQPDITTYLDAIKQQYDAVLEENKNLKQENMRLVEANSQYIRKVQYYMGMVSKHKSSSQIDSSAPSLDRISKCIKRGSDWVIEGDQLCEISLRKKYVMPSKITHSIINKNGRYIAFSCGQKGFVIADDVIYHLNPITEKIELFDQTLFDTISHEFKAFFMSFSEDSSFLYVADSRGTVRKWDIEEKIQVSSFKVVEPVGVKVVDNYVYVAGRDRTIRVYENEEEYISFQVNEDLNGPFIVNAPKNIAYAIAGKNKLMTIDILNEAYNTTTTDEERIISLAVSTEQKMLSLGGYNRTISVYKIKNEKKNCKHVDTIEQKGAVLALEFIEGLLLVGQPEGFMVWDTRNKKSMKIHISDSNVIGINAGVDTFITLDTSGVLRQWKYRSVEN